MAVTADLNGNRIHLRSTRLVRALADAVPGANFSKSGGAHWSIPLTLASIAALRRRFKDELVLTEALAEWRTSNIATNDYLADLAQRDRAEIGITNDGTLRVWEEDYPKLAGALRNRPYQTVGARFIAEGRRVLICDTVGLGKTAQALGGVMESGVEGPYLVICPKTAGYSVWGPEINQWLPGHVAGVVPESRDLRDRYLQRALVSPKRPVLWMIINPWMLHTRNYWQCNRCKSRTLAKKGKRVLDCEHDPKKTRTVQEFEFPSLFEIEWGAIIIDESHKVLIKPNRVSSQTRTGADLLQSRENGLRIAQTGTPFRSNPPLLWGTLNWIRGRYYTAYWSWVQTYWEVESGFNNAMTIGALKREKALAQSLRGTMLRRTREEVAPHLPERQYIGTPHPSGLSAHGIWLPMGEQQARVYQEMVADSVARLENGDLDAIGSLAELSRLRQFSTAYAVLDDKGDWKPAAPSNKLDYILDTVLPELGYGEDGSPPSTKVVFVSQFTKILELFAGEVRRVHGPIACELTGKVTGRKRAQMVDQFNVQGAPPYVMFLNSDAGGESITLDAADEMVFIDEKHDPDVQEQAEGRIDNRRPEEKIVRRRYRYLRSLDTVEEDIALAAAERGFESQKVLRDGERFTRKILKLT